MAGRERRRIGYKRDELKPWRQEEVRAHIGAMTIVSRLQRHVEGELDMSPTQIQAARALLDRVLPVLQSAEVHHHDDTAHASEAELMQRLTAMLAALPPEVRALVVSEVTPSAATVQ